MFKNIGVSLLSNGNKNIFTNFTRSVSWNRNQGNLINTRKVVCQKWKAYNDKVYPPQGPDEPRRPGFVCHVTEDIKYSYKRMWYVACFIRGMSIDEALKQLQFLKYKGAQIATDALLKAQAKAVEEHNIEYKSNLWVSESFVGKAQRIKGYRKCAFKMSVVHYDYIHYFLTLEEGSPPEYYYYHKRPKSGNELLEEWLQEMRSRKVIEGL